MIKFPLFSIDTGIYTGWCVGHIDYKGSVVSGVEPFTLKKGEDRGYRHDRFLFWLKRMKEKHQYKGITYEEVVMHHKSHHSARVYHGFASMLELFCEREGVPLYRMSVKAIKRQIAGNGNATKQMVLDAVKKLGFKELTDFNEADAIALWLCVTARSAHLEVEQLLLS